MLKELRTTFTLFILLMLITGLGYPMLVLGVGQTLFPTQANGSLIEADGKIIGSMLIGQNFTTAKYFHPRPSYAGNGYDAANSSGSNLGPTSPDLLKAVNGRVMDLGKSGNVISVPVDLVTASASGLDPDISPAAARFQVRRVAAARNMSAMQIETLVTQHITPRTFDSLGENRVNVLGLNQALDRLAAQGAPVR